MPPNLDGVPWGGVGSTVRVAPRQHPFEERRGGLRDSVLGEREGPDGELQRRGSEG